MKQPGVKDIMRQAQKMQQDMHKAQEKLKKEIISVDTNGGMIQVKISGDLKIKEVVIHSDVINSDDPEMLQDMVVVAVNQAIEEMQQLINKQLGGVTGGLSDLGI